MNIFCDTHKNRYLNIPMSNVEFVNKPRGKKIIQISNSE